MKVFFTVLLLVGLASAAPTSEDDKVIITKEFFPDTLAKYTAQYDIVNMLVPLNNLNFEMTDDGDFANSDTYLFFVEADTDQSGKRVDKGLYVMKNYHVTKLLDHGRDVAAASDDSKTAFFGAKEGLYVYNIHTNKADKYGPITDSIISIAKVNNSDVIYILTDDHVLYKVTDEGTKKTKVDAVVNAQQIVLDYENNLYYYTPDKHVYVYTTEGVKKFEGLPTGSYVNILKPPFHIENGVPVIVDNKAYVVYVNGTTETTDFEFVVKPTAYSMEAAIFEYFAYDKKIYEYNLLEIITSEILEELKTYIGDSADAIQEFATKTKVHGKFTTKNTIEKTK